MELSILLRVHINVCLITYYICNLYMVHVRTRVNLTVHASASDRIPSQTCIACMHVSHTEREHARFQRAEMAQPLAPGLLASTIEGSVNAIHLPTPNAYKYPWGP